LRKAWRHRENSGIIRIMTNSLQHLANHCHAFKGADVKTSVRQLGVTAALFLIACALMLYGAANGLYWLYALPMLPAAGLLTRLFIIQHDCGHGSYFKSRAANDRVGRVLSLFTVTPYAFWRDAHNMHHAGSGNLDRRGIGSIDTLTVAEYRALPMSKRIAYRLYRHPVILLLLGTPLYVIVLQRLPSVGALTPIENYRSLPPARAWRSILSLDLAMAVAYGIAGALIGWPVLLAVYLPVVVITSWIGGWMFFIQHQFEDTVWKQDGEWNFQEAALKGSSHYVLPPVLQWFTGNIGIHHIHHLCALIPNYRLQKCVNANAELKNMNRMTLRQSLQCLRWHLWDEGRGRMVSFGDLR
jgi:omega-6 fatty acid desaturase (delta-12 desaturase)